jgi:hypothetical protein
MRESVDWIKLILYIVSLMVFMIAKMNCFVP